MIDVEAPDELLGQVLAGKYRLVRRLGEGGMGAVYLARQQPLDREVVVKVMRDELARDPAYRDRFVKEAKAISALSHPNIVSLFDFGITEQGVLFLAMEALKGRTLHELIQTDGPLEEERCLVIITGILRALAEVHAIGIVHRDLKPENVFITTSSTGEEIVKVLDFGLAKVMQTKDTKRAQQSAIVGTPGYMAPEQMKGDEIGPATDIYALGIIWWEMLIGNRVYAEVLDHHTRMLKMVVEGVPPPSSVRPLSLVEGHEALVMRMLSKNPAARPQDAAACLPLLRAIAGNAWLDISGEIQSATASERRDAMDAVRGVPTETARSPARRTPARSVPGSTAAMRVPPPQSASLAGPRLHLRNPRVLAAAAGGVLVMILVVAAVAGGRGPAADVVAPPAAPPAASPAPVAVAPPQPSPLPPAAMAVAPRRVRFSSTPPGAMVHRADDGAPVGGPTPFTAEVTTTAGASFVFSKEGYEEVRASLGAFDDVVVDLRPQAPVVATSAAAKAAAEKRAKEKRLLAAPPPVPPAPPPDVKEIPRMGVLNPYQN